MTASEQGIGSAVSRSELAAWVDELKNNRRWRDGVRAVDYRPAKAGVEVDWPEHAHPDLKLALQRRGVERLWSHQVEAWQALESGQSVVVATPTASGKSAAYLLPILQTLLTDDSATVLLFFPTKALAQDQCAELNALLEAAGLDEQSHVYDGDTPSDLRRKIRDSCRVILTNPDMLHASILPNADKWGSFLRNLRFVVVDEMHVYRGVFGSHVANVMRRLRRILARHGASPVIALTSATIANPAELGEQLAGAPVKVVDESGAPEGERWFILINPPIIDHKLQRRLAPSSAARRLVLQLLRQDFGAIIFTRSRQGVETLTHKLREDARRGRGHVERSLADRIRGYRGGYLPQERRQIEAELRNGTVACVVSTNALELGIDIGSLDACLIAGYPGTIASTWQQAGRAGRRRGGGVAVLFAGEDAVDQFLVNHPEYFFSASPEHARIDANNLRILSDHIKCAAFELPFRADEGFDDVPQDLTQEILEFLADETGMVTYADELWRWSDRSYPAGAISLRDIPEENIVIIDTSNARKNNILGEIDYESAFVTVYDQAIYQHGGYQYEVHRFDLPMRKAYVRKVDSEYYTQAISNTRVFPLDIFDESEDSTRAGCGEVRVVRHVQGYKKIRYKTAENIGYGEIKLPELETHTTAFWITYSPEDLDSLQVNEQRLMAGLDGLLHALHTVAIVHLMCDRGDLTTVQGSGDWQDPDKLELLEDPSISGPILDTVSLYLIDKCPGGTGFSERLYELRSDIIAAGIELIEACECESGCPACIGPPPEGQDAIPEVAVALGRLALGAIT